jgi:hypothetical protein
MNLRQLLDGPQRYEQEKPILIVDTDPEIKYANDQLDAYEIQAKAEIESTIKELRDRHAANHRALWANIEALLKEKNLMPADFNDKSDMLSIQNGVLFFCRPIKTEGNGDESYF